MQISKGKTKHIVFVNQPSVTLDIEQQADSCLYVYVANVGDCIADNKITVRQLGEHCETHIYGISLLTGNAKVNNQLHVTHAVSNGKSEQLFKYAVADYAQGSFKAELIIKQDAQHVEAHQTNRNILLSDTAKMHTEPQLEIYADDVKASHGASTGRLSEEALFYMQQRGIDLHSANKLLLNAFFEDVVAQLPEDEQNHVRLFISEQLNLIL